jgi:hypothetical protein
MANVSAQKLTVNNIVQEVGTKYYVCIDVLYIKISSDITFLFYFTYIYIYICIYIYIYIYMGHAVAQLVTSRKVVDSIPDCVIEIFH